MTEWILQSLGSTPAGGAIDLETAVFLVVVVVSLLGRLFGRKQDPEHGQEWFDDDGDPHNQQQQGGAVDWEEQMRRLLEGEPAQPQQPQQQTQSNVPPPVPQEAPPPIPVATPIGQSTSNVPVFSVEDLKKTHAALEEAKQKAAAARANLGGVSERRTRHKPQAQAAIRLLSTPTTAQQAIIASVILGKPKGLD